MTLPSKILIAGGPKTGKTTLARVLAESYGLKLLHTDDLIGKFDWSAASAEVATWIGKEPSIIEGVAVPRALRKWFAANPSGKPCDLVIWLDKPLVMLSTGQVTMAKGCLKVWGEIVGELKSRDVEVGYGIPSQRAN